MEEGLNKLSSKTIKEWAEEERPREKMLLKGEKALTKAELIAILFGNGTQQKSAVDLAKELLALTDGNLSQLSRLGIRAFMAIKGIGEVKALTLMAALELGRRKQQDGLFEMEKVVTSRDAFELLQPIIGDLPHEVFMVLYLNMASKVLHKDQISSGGISSTIVDIRMILRSALQWHATQIVLAHNHPSGNTNPSVSDKNLTQKLYQAGLILDIRVSDHIIVTNKGYFSFADNGLL